MPRTTATKRARGEAIAQEVREVRMQTTTAASHAGSGATEEREECGSPVSVHSSGHVSQTQEGTDTYSGPSCRRPHPQEACRQGGPC